MTGADTGAKPYKGVAMEGPIATWYARNAARDRRRFTRVARMIAQRVTAGGRILEVAPGPGYLAIELARAGAYSVCGLDISHSFVRIARANARDADVPVEFMQGNAAQMPYPDEVFDFAVCTAAFKNFTDPVGALNEIYRVLRPGGHALIQDLRKEASTDDVAREVGDLGLSAVNAAVTRWIFRHVLLRNAYTQASLSRLVAQSRFCLGHIDVEGIAFELWLKKESLLPRGLPEAP